MESNRRKFLIQATKIGAVSLCSASLCSALKSCETYFEIGSASTGVTVYVDISSETDFPEERQRQNLQRIGYGVLKRFSTYNYGIPVIIVRLSESEFTVLSSMCTHDHCFGDDMQMPRGYFPDNPNFYGFQLITCGCHASKFDPFDGGKVVEGPAEKPLKHFPTRFNPETNILEIDF